MTVVRTLFSGTASSKSILRRVLNDCGYCAEPLNTGEKKATFDHIRPDSAWGEAFATNGMLTCQPCNNSRGNVPFLNFLQGEHGNYAYRENGTIAERGIVHRSSPEVTERRQKSISNHFKQLLEGSEQLDTSYRPKNWFAGALDNIVYPVWKQGNKPSEWSKLESAYTQRVKEFLGIMGGVDHDFWLGGRFEPLVQTKMSATPGPQKILLNALDQLKSQGGLVLRFAGKLLKAKESA